MMFTLLWNAPGLSLPFLTAPLLAAAGLWPYARAAILVAGLVMMWAVVDRARQRFFAGTPGRTRSTPGGCRGCSGCEDDADPGGAQRSLTALRTSAGDNKAAKAAISTASAGKKEELGHGAQ